MPLSLALWDRRSLANLIDRAADDLSELTATLIRWWPSTGVQLGDYDLDYHIDIVLEGLGLAEGDRGRMVSTLSGAEKVRAIWTRSRSVWPTLGVQTGTTIDSYWDGLPGHWEERKTELLGYGLFAWPELLKPVASLSVGQKRKLQIAQLIALRANLLLLDEPTNHISFDILEEFEQTLLDFPGPVLAVSHDRRFIQRFADEVLELREGTLVRS